MAMVGGASECELDMEMAMNTKKSIEFFLKREISTYEPEAQLKQVEMPSRNLEPCCVHPL